MPLTGSRARKRLCYSAATRGYYVGYWPILLKNSKMGRRQNFAVLASRPIVGNPMHYKELTKAAGWKSV
jgi:hypothetical protein